MNVRTYFAVRDETGMLCSALGEHPFVDGDKDGEAAAEAATRRQAEQFITSGPYHQLTVVRFRVETTSKAIAIYRTPVQEIGE